MLQFFRRIAVALAIFSGVSCASAFSMLGPFATWETADLSYDAGGGIDIGGPMNLTEEYRWNIKTITYGFDQTFLDYFGQDGVNAVNQAVAILNALPPASQMSASLSEFPQDTRRINYQAQSLGLLDLRTWALGLLVEEMGLADPERYVWTLRDRRVIGQTTNYWVIMRNFDPATLTPSRYVNGILYTYTINEFGPAPQFSDASEATVDPLAIGYNSVAGIADFNDNLGTPTEGGSYFTSGLFWTGLTRDDVGSIRYKLNKKNLNPETLVGNVTSAGGGAWTPVGGGGGGNGSNNLVSLAERPGADRIQFKLIKYYGQFPGATNVYTDTYITNGHAATQRVARILTQPDILFSAGDLGVFEPGGQPVLFERFGPWPAAWNNNALFGAPPAGVEQDGPGVIQSPIFIAFTTIGPTFVNQTPPVAPFQNEFNSSLFFGGWGVFDGTTNLPIVFPNGASVEELQQNIMDHGFF